jgi:hypothetical protein
MGAPGLLKGQRKSIGCNVFCSITVPDDRSHALSQTFPVLFVQVAECLPIRLLR